MAEYNETIILEDGWSIYIEVLNISIDTPGDIFTQEMFIWHPGCQAWYYMLAMDISGQNRQEPCHYSACVLVEMVCKNMSFHHIVV